jgi:hypothetical protein
MTIRRSNRRTPHRSRRGLKLVALATGVAACGSVLVGVPATAATTQTASCRDGGGHLWKGRSIWGSVYTSRSGARRVRNNHVAFTSAAPGATTVDYRIRTYNASGQLIQTLAREDRRYRFARGSVYLVRNPRNPASGPGRSKIVVTVGDGNDGRRGCTMTFVQPGTTSQPNPTPTPRTVTAFTTGYTWWDNSPARSAAIARPVLHRTAGGVGTYADPITMAVGYTRAGLDIPAGTRFYLPNLRKYFIVEDICGACHNKPPGTVYKLDLWLDGRYLSRSQARACAGSVTGRQPVVRNPPRGLSVRSGAICS